MPEVISEMRGAALILAFNRPEKGNAMTPDMASQAGLILKNATTDNRVRAVMLRGAGAEFMSGLDMEIYAGNLEKGVEKANQMMQPYNSAIREMNLMEKPVLAVVKGRVSGPGMSFMLASDLVLAAEGSVFNCGFSTFGLTPDGGSSYFLARRAGAAKAAEWLMLSENISVADAMEWGLVNAVVDETALEAQAMSWIDRLANGPTRAFGGVKKLIAKAFMQDLNLQMGLEHTYWGASARSFDFREAVKAHFAGREPKYSGV
ncbi:MAG: enoyl-CoA hydratase-related protein [Bdellovibrionales bacterium]